MSTKHVQDPLEVPPACPYVDMEWGDVAALVRSHMNGSLPFEKTIEQTI